MALDEHLSLLVRESAMKWLDQRPSANVDFSWLSNFEYDGQRIPLMDRQRGIRKPAILDEALSIRTVFTDPRATPPYDDAIGPDGLQRYKYRGDNPEHPENVALRRARERQLPLIWFVGVAPGAYEPIYPIWVVGEEPRALQFALALDSGQRLVQPGADLDEDTRRYVERVTKARLHQRIFRSQVIHAYDGRCAVCNLGHLELIDAAHIVADGKPQGQPVVPNGLALCKIHHAAFDARVPILGIRPDLTLHVRADILEEIDGPMLRHGLQEMHNKQLMKLPSSRIAHPDALRLEERYAEFLSAS